MEHKETLESSPSFTLLPDIWGYCECRHIILPHTSRCGWCGREVDELKPQVVYHATAGRKRHSANTASSSTIPTEKHHRSQTKKSADKASDQGSLF